MERTSVERRSSVQSPVHTPSAERRVAERRHGDRRRPHAYEVERRRGRQHTVTLPQSTYTSETHRGVLEQQVGHGWLIRLANTVVNPLALVASLFVVALIVHAEIAPRHLLLALVTAVLTYRGHFHLTKTIPGVARHVLASWLAVSLLLFFMGWLTATLQYFDRTLLFAWWCAAPLAQFVAHVLLRWSKPAIVRLLGPPKRAVIVGFNEQGIELARRIDELPSHLRLAGFFDDRPSSDFYGQHRYPLLGRLPELPRFANENNINVIYISLPMVHQPRIEALLDGLRDTTASIYFVPNIFVTDLIQGRVDTVNGVPVVAVCETPLTGVNGVIKRASDVVFSLTTLVLLLPLLAAIALGVKLTSPGPVIFRQRRYGVDGKEIVVYKFRTMAVTEDGDTVRQAGKHDARVTRFGALLRKTSMDELPQLVNVLQGRMSVVGPRPHAVAHNEMYRKLISGYMVRHKVRPGITGWAQVNGLRGETESVDKMRERVSYDLDYLRNWSLRFDGYIVAKTLWVVLKGDKNAY